MKNLLFLILFLSINIVSFSQAKTDKEKAYEKAKEAIAIMDQGNYDESIQLLEESWKLDRRNFNYPYEIGYAYILKKDYATACEYFEYVVKMNKINDQCYQMLGNAYSMAGKPKKAIAAYNKGLELFPNSGRLYLELGNMQGDDLNQAIKFYEKGVMADPNFSSNYYWLTKLFCRSTEEMWGMLYGEMFMNIERGSKRTEEISKLLFDTYKSEIQFTTDSTIMVSFCKNHEFRADNMTGKLPFSMIYEPGLMFAITVTDSINLESLNKIRSEHCMFYFDRKFDQMHPNLVFDWHKFLIEDDLFECYNYWLLMKGAPDEFDSWYNLNREKYDEFIKWFAANPLEIDDSNCFHRLKH
ncbi:tetratricopeptide repeat protein [Marinifilum caeruleilacunae]|uniref:Tetratricopeptide repeat protein n=1 Tax=Marinifilum caeruleilacunae TaxID=2499076 RepID=A0ABX1WW04_9BACT|nr:tetratricopeptide repeat protein [Marinifilum caeruleilacunae]NOU60186.1 tetratricopeptide repeat protein [Marinifilum caeruleilacunae]